MRLIQILKMSRYIGVGGSVESSRLKTAKNDWHILKNVIVYVVGKRGHLKVTFNEETKTEKG